MIEIRLRAAASNPSSRPWRRGICLTLLVLGVIAPAATSRAQDAPNASSTATRADMESLRALKRVSLEAGKDIVIDGGESITITTGAASITMRKDGVIILKGTDIVIDGAGKAAIRPNGAPIQQTRASQMSEIF